MGGSLFGVGVDGSRRIEENGSEVCKERLMELYADHYRGEFEANMDRCVPRHPWFVFKEVREEIEQVFEGQERFERVFVAERLFEEFKKRWESFRRDFDGT